MNDSSATPTVDARIKIRNLFERVWKRKQTNERTIRNRQATRTDIGLLVVAGARKWKNEKKNVGRNRDRVENSFVNALLHITHVVGSRKRSRSPAHGCAKQEKKAKQNYIYSFSLHLRNVNLYPIGKLAYVGPPTYLHSPHAIRSWASPTRHPSHSDTHVTVRSIRASAHSKSPSASRHPTRMESPIGQMIPAICTVDAHKSSRATEKSIYQIINSRDN